MKITGMIRRVDAVGQDPAQGVNYVIEYEREVVVGNGDKRTDRAQVILPGEPGLYSPHDQVSISVTKTPTS